MHFLWPLSIVITIVLCGANVTHPPSEGEQLAKSYCSSCHLYPPPDLLPKQIWRDVVLPQMGHQFGIYTHDSIRTKLIEQGPGGAIVLGKGLFPETPTINLAIWKKICDFYIDQAPVSLANAPLPVLDVHLPNFRPRVPAVRLSIPSTTMVHFMPQGGLCFADANTKRLYWIDSTLVMKKNAKLAEGITAMQLESRGMYVTIMGSFSPTDAPVGTLIHIPNDQAQAQIMLEGLQRPVHSQWADLNHDGLMDAVVCEYAKWTGCLAFWQQRPDSTFQKNVLRNRPGAIKTYLRDLDKDGDLDILALFGQGDEGIFRYINDGKGSFVEETVIRFPPTYGSSSFRLHDVNGDGWEDIIYTCGDNADYKPVLKPYHGMRIFEHKNTNRYEEIFFYPMQGAYDAIPADFDQDGDLDFALVSFFPDFAHHPQSAFLLLENNGRFQFTGHTFSGVKDGRWMVMDIGDLELDGDLDLVLGPLTFEVVPDGGEVKHWLQKGIPFVVLENTISR